MALLFTFHCHIKWFYSFCIKILVGYVFITISFPSILYGQQSHLQKIICLSRNSGTTEQILEEIRQKGNFYFNYSNQIPLNKQVIHKDSCLSVKAYLDLIFAMDSVSYLEQGNSILLIPKQESKKTEYYNQVSGIVLDKDNNRPIPFANIFIVHKNNGTVSNRDGNFQLYLNSWTLSDSIGISCIGYRLNKYAFQDYLNKDTVFMLLKNRIQIREVYVRPQYPRTLMQNAIKKIPENYSKKPVMLTSFFRESSLQDDKFISLAEAIVEIYKESYMNNRKDRIKILKGRSGTNVDKPNLLFTVRGGLYYNYQLDVVKYGIEFLDPEYFNEYEYTFEKVIIFNDRPTYELNFKPNSLSDKAIFEGVILMDIETLAIVSVSFNITRSNLKEMMSSLILKTPAYTKIKPITAEYFVAYRQFNDNWTLNSGRGEISLNVKRKKNPKDNYTFTSVSEFVTTYIDTLNISRFTSSEISKPKDVLAETVENFDYSFWKGNTIILPTEPLIETIDKFVPDDQLLSPQMQTTP